MNFYPNPATDYIVLQGLDHLHQGDIIKVSIVDGLGRIVKQIRQLERTQIEVSDLTAGLYYLSVFRNGQEIATEKVVIQ